MNRILIIGATGNVGRQILAQLPATGGQVRALMRNPDAADLPPEVETVRGDLTLPDTLDECLDGIDAVFLVWCASAASAPPAMERIAKHAPDASCSFHLRTRPHTHCSKVLSRTQYRRCMRESSG